MAGIKLVSTLSFVIKPFVFVIFMFVFVPFLVLIFALLSPIYLLRFIISNLKFCGPNLAKLIPTRGNLFSFDKLYGNTKCGVLLCITLKGNSPDIISHLRHTVAEKLICGRDENGEPTKFKADQMRQFPYRWMGFYFWKWDDTFDISNHINFYTSYDVDEHSTVPLTKLRQIEDYILWKPFMKNKSPWEIIVVQNVESENGEPRSVMFFRYHHVISDGLSAMKIFFTAFFDNKTTTVDQFITKPRVVEYSTFTQFLIFCNKILNFPFHYKKYMIDGVDNNEWISPDNKLRNKNITILSDKLKLADLKEIAQFHKVSVNAVIYSAFTAAVRNAMLRKNGKIPKHLHIGVPVFLPGHPNKLAVHVSLVALRLPIGESSSEERLTKVQANFEELKISFFPVFIFHLIPFIGALFPSMIKFVASSASALAGSSSFPGPRHTEYICGEEMIDLHFLSGTFTAHNAIMYNTVTYRDGFRIIITSNSPMLQDKSEVEQIVKDIQEEFSNFQTKVIV